MLYLVFVIKNCRFHVFSKSSPIKLGFFKQHESIVHFCTKCLILILAEKQKAFCVQCIYICVLTWFVNNVTRGHEGKIQQCQTEIKQESNFVVLKGGSNNQCCSKHYGFSYHLTSFVYSLQPYIQRYTRYKRRFKRLEQQ